MRASPPEYNVAVTRSRFAMLRACRVARSVRLLLLVGALFAVAGSFGLHPEPTAEDVGAATDRTAWTAGAPADSASHGCMACLAHRSVSLQALCVFVPAADVTHVAVVASPVDLLLPSADTTDDGRAPPLSA